MSQIDVLFSKLDKLSFAKLAFEKECVFIVDRNYPKKEYYVIDNIEKLSTVLNSNVLLFLIHPALQSEPLEWGELKGNVEDKYYLKQKCGGPTIDVYWPGLPESQNQVLVPGFIGDNLYYYVNGRRTKSEKEYQKLYNYFSKYIKSNCTLAKCNLRSFWVGSNAVVLCKSGKASVPSIGNCDLKSVILDKC